MTVDTVFSQVMHLCASSRQDTWITEDMYEAYNKLHDQGIAHSFEVWHEEKLVGGLYGLALGHIFFGESMFSLMSDASKVAFVHLTKQLESWHFPLIDCQVENNHLLSLGAECIPREAFQSILKKNVTSNLTHKPWTLEWEWSKP